jgi:hypothetical protein
VLSKEKDATISLRFLFALNKRNGNSFTDMVILLTTPSLSSAGPAVRAVPCQKNALNYNRHFTEDTRLTQTADSRSLSNSPGVFWSVNSKFLTKKSAPLTLRCILHASVSEAPGIHSADPMTTLLKTSWRGGQLIPIDGQKCRHSIEIRIISWGHIRLF